MDSTLTKTAMVPPPGLLFLAGLLCLCRHGESFIPRHQHHHQHTTSLFVSSSSRLSSPLSANNNTDSEQGGANPPPPPFVLNTFLSSSPENVAASPTATTSSSSWQTTCDDVNRPPSLNILLRTLHQLTREGSSTDIRGRFTNHKMRGKVSSIAHEIARQDSGPYAPLTPFAAYCLGHGLAQLVLSDKKQRNQQTTTPIRIAIGQDPRGHGMRLADSFARGAESVGNVQVLYTGVATTPACAAFCRLHGTDAAVMITASHLPADRNGFKMFWKDNGQCLTNEEIALLGSFASQCAVDWFTKGLAPPSSGEDAVFCHEWVDFMPRYATSLKRSIQKEVEGNADKDQDTNCLEGLTLVVNAGHGSGGFFNQVIKDLGANVEGSIGIEPNSEFPLGIPNPEYKPMIDATIKACQTVEADLGIMLDTDSDRCGFVVKTNQRNYDGSLHYEPLNRNRLIALLGVLFAETNPGCAVVTDSVTSEGLSTFLEEKLGLRHVRYLKGYQNVIGKARELTELGVLNAELAMETSGHGAMKENYYVDDGTYTALKVVSLLARQKQQNMDRGAQTSLLDLIADMEEMDVIAELRFKMLDDSLQTMHQVFDYCALEIERLSLTDEDDSHSELAAVAAKHWSIDEDNLEGIRLRVGQGQFFMMRKSLHDPILSLQIEAVSHEEAKRLIVDPLLQLFESEPQIKAHLDMAALRDF